MEKQYKNNMKFMKSTKASLIAALTVALCLLAVRHCSRKNPPIHRRQRVLRLLPVGMKRPDFAKELNLTEDQKPKFEAIMKDSMQKRRDLRADTALTPEDKRTKAKAHSRGNRQAIERIADGGTIRQMGKMAGGMRRNGPPEAAPALRLLLRNRRKTNLGDALTEGRP